jgi:hypothetical protein
MVADHQGGEHQGRMNPSTTRQADFRFRGITSIPGLIGTQEPADSLGYRKPAPKEADRRNITD